MYKEKKFDEIIKDFTPLIKASINKYFKNNESFEDAFQDGVLKVLELIKTFNENENISFSCYLKHMLKYFYMQKFFKEKQRKEHTFTNTYILEDEEKIDILENIEDENEDVEKEILNMEMKKDVKTVILTLPKKQREVIYLKFYKNLKNKEIAKKMNIKEDTVKEYYKIAKKKLKNKLIV